MTVFSIATRAALVVLVAAAGGCASVDEADSYGYEESFVLPEPDMVPVMPDDNPGRTVDEMLEYAGPSVVVKKASVEKTQDPEPSYERSGRFGSKEKVALRKGLNAPEAKIVYGSQKREETKIVRALELKQEEKDRLQALSEQEILAKIIAPKENDVQVIEVVKTESETKTVKEKAPAKAVEMPAPVPVPVSAPVAVEVKKPVAVVEQTPVVVKPVKIIKIEQLAQKQQPVKKVEALVPFVKEPVKAASVLNEPSVSDETIVLKKPSVVFQETVVLIPPERQDDEFILIAPEENKSEDQSIEIFLDE